MNARSGRHLNNHKRTHLCNRLAILLWATMRGLAPVKTIRAEIPLCYPNRPSGAAMMHAFTGMSAYQASYSVSGHTRLYPAGNFTEPTFAHTWYIGMTRLSLAESLRDTVAFFYCFIMLIGQASGEFGYGLGMKCPYCARLLQRSMGVDKGSTATFPGRRLRATATSAKQLAQNRV